MDLLLLAPSGGDDRRVLAILADLES